MIQRTQYAAGVVGYRGKKRQLECPKHGIQVFNYEKVGKRYRCGRCNADAVYQRKMKLKAELVEAAGGCCTRCGYNKSVTSLHFHHRNRSEKIFNLSQMTSFSKELVRTEAEKCDLLCANCHGEIEDEIRTRGAVGAHSAYNGEVEGSNPSESTDFTD